MAGARAGASTSVDPFTQCATQCAIHRDSGAELSQPAPPALAAAGAPDEKHLFPVRDEKGLLLSCVAPEFDTNRDTDIFKHCTLAPGRTLDEVMHSFIKAIHQEEHQRAEQADPEEKTDSAKPDEKAAQK
jgi:hypothetical protein